MVTIAYAVLDDVRQCGTMFEQSNERKGVGVSLQVQFLVLLQFHQSCMHPK